jgi:hypothetical protein
MRFSVLILFALLGCNASLSQSSKLKPEFDPIEFKEVLLLEWAHQDSGYVPPYIPTGYKRVFRSQEVGLKNKFDIWLSDDSVAVVCVRYTVRGGPSWLENFYSGMVKAKGVFEYNQQQFEYAFSDDERAYVHHGWAIGASALGPILVEQINSLYKQGIKNYIITGHSQGAALSYLLRSYLEYLPQGKVPKDINYKLYCCAAPKPGNVFYSYDFDALTKNKWAYRVINAEDWVPTMPFANQIITDLPEINPFSKRKEIMGKRIKNPIIKWYVNHAIKDMNGATKKANKKYGKYLNKKMSKFVKRNLENYKPVEVQHSNNYVSAGTSIVLRADKSYHDKYKYDGLNVFIHHMFESYLYVLDLNYPTK